MKLVSGSADRCHQKAGPCPDSVLSCYPNDLENLHAFY